MFNKRRADSFTMFALKSAPLSGELETPDMIQAVRLRQESRLWEVVRDINKSTNSLMIGAI